MRTFKRFLSLAVVLVMVISLMPAAVFAADPSEDALVISDTAGLVAFANAVNGGNDYAGKTVTLGADLTLKGEWTPIGAGSYGAADSTPFKGTFDGKGHTISGLTITDTNPKDTAKQALGLFGIVDGGTVKNLKLEVSITVSDSRYVGAVAGVLTGGGTIDSVTVTGNINGNAGVGGIVGRMMLSGTISNCVNNAYIYGADQEIGGIAGAAYLTATGKAMTISECTNNGIVVGTQNVGGIVGQSSANVTGCTNTAAVTGNHSAVGGIVGQQQSYGAVSGNTNTATVTNIATASDQGGTGGIIGWIAYDGAAEDYPLKDVISVTDNKNSGTVSSSENQAGGIVGLLDHGAVVTGNLNTAERLEATVHNAGIVASLRSSGDLVQGTAQDSVEIVTGNVTISNNGSSTTMENMTATNKKLYYNYHDGAAESAFAGFPYENNYTVACMITSGGFVSYAASLQAAVDAAQDGDTITVLADISGEAVTVNKSLTINGSATLNNVTISDSGAVNTLTVKGLTFTGESWIKTESVKELTVEKCTFVTTGTSSPVCGTGAIEKAAITGNTFGSAQAPLAQDGIVKFTDFTTDGAEFTLTGNTVYTESKAFFFSQLPGVKYAVAVEENNFHGAGNPIWLETANGEDTCDGTVEASSNNTISTAEGKEAFTPAGITTSEALTNFTGYLVVDVEVDVQGKLIGGTFAKKPSQDLLAEGYKARESGGLYEVFRPVAEVGGVEYETLQAAVDAAKDGDTITVIQDVSDEEVTLKKSLTIEGTDGATLNNVTIHDAVLTGEEEFKTVSTSSYLLPNLGSSTTYAKDPSNVKKENGNNSAIIMWLSDNIASTHRTSWLNTLNTEGFAVTITLSDGTTTTRYIPKAELATNANDGAYHRYKLDDIPVKANTKITDMTMFVYSGGGVDGQYIETRSEDKNVDVYLNIKVEGDIEGKTATEDSASPYSGGTYYTKYYLSQAILVDDKTEKVDRTLNLDGLTFTGSSAVDVKVAELTVDNCTFNTTTPIQAAGSVAVEVMSTTTVGGNPFTMENISVDEAFAGSLAVGVKTDDSGKLIGGTFTQEPSADRIALGYLVKESEGLYTVVAPVAMIGETGYATLQEAMDAAQNGDTITVIQDVSDETVAVDKNVTITGDATLNNVTINDEPLTPEEELAALTDADIYKGGSTTWSYNSSNLTVVDTNYVVKGPDPLYPELGDVIYADVAKGHAQNPNYYVPKGFKPIATNGLGVNGLAGNTIPAAELLANQGDGKYHVYKIEDLEFVKDTATTIGLFISNGMRCFYNYKPTENATVDVYISMRIEGDISCTDSTKYPVYYVKQIVFAYDKPADTVDALKLDGLTFTGNSTVDLDITEKLTVENCTFNTTTTPIQVKGDIAVEVMSSTTVGGNPFPMENISVDASFTGSLAVGVKTDENGMLIGGTFTQEPSADRIAAGYKAQEIDGLYEIIVKLPAEFNGKQYETLQEAIDAAKAAGGGTVKLTSDQKVGTVIVPTGVTLDLQTYTLIADCLIGVSGSTLTAAPKINATDAYGKLVVAKDNVLLSKNSTVDPLGYNYHVLPVWNAADGAYEFAMLRVNNSLNAHGLTVTEDKIEYRFRHQTTNYYKSNLLNDGGLDNGVKVTLTLSYENDLGKAEQTFVYNDDFFATVNNASNMDYTFKLENYESVGVDLSGKYKVTITIAIVTDCGMGHYVTVDVN